MIRNGKLCRLNIRWVLAGMLALLIACGKGETSATGPCEARSPCSLGEHIVDGTCTALLLPSPTCSTDRDCLGAPFECEDGACIQVDAPGRFVTLEGDWRIVVTDYSPPPQRCMLPQPARQVSLLQTDERFDVIDASGNIEVGRRPEPTTYFVDLDDEEHALVFLDNTSGEGTLRGPTGEARTTWLRVDLPPAPMPNALRVEGTTTVAQFRYTHPELEMWLLGERYVGHRSESRAAMYNYETQTSAHLYGISETEAMLVLRREAGGDRASEERILRLVESEPALDVEVIPGPTLTEVTPALDLPIGDALQTFTFRFDRPLNPSTVTTDTFLVEQLSPAGVRDVPPREAAGYWEVDGNEAQFTPHRLVPFGARYRFTATDAVRGMQDLAVHGERSWTWTTRAHFSDRDVEIWDAETGGVWVTSPSGNEAARWVEVVPPDALSDLEPGASLFRITGQFLGQRIFQSFDDTSWDLAFVGTTNLGAMQARDSPQSAPSATLTISVHSEPATEYEAPEGWLVSPWTFALWPTYSDESQPVQLNSDGRVQIAERGDRQGMRVQLAIPRLGATR